MQQLYRHFDKDGKLLYVGISYNALSRLGQHKRKAHWFKDIANVTIEQFATRKEVEEAELKAIRLEKPLHNIQGVINTSPEGVELKWRKPRYKILGKLLLRGEYIPAYLELLTKLKIDRREYELTIDQSTLTLLYKLLFFRTCMWDCPRSHGGMNIIVGYSFLKLPVKLSINERARDILIQARDVGDTWLENKYDTKDGWYATSSWYVEEGSKKVASIEFQGCGIGNKYK